MALTPIELVDTSIGSITYGTNLEVNCPNNGTKTTISTMTLNKGKYIIGATGFSPIGEFIFEPATSVQIHNGASFEGGTSLMYLFNCCKAIEVLNNNSTITFDVINWQSEALTSNKNYKFYAIKIA